MDTTYAALSPPSSLVLNPSHGLSLAHRHLVGMGKLIDYNLV